jgi:hypothetical protein
MKRTLRSERGIAMIAALGAIVLIGVIIGGVLFSVTQDYRISDNSLRQSRATSTAELGMNRVVTEWNLAWNQKLTGDTLKRSYATSGGGIANVEITKLNGPFFWVISEGLSGTTRSTFLARRRYGVLLRLDTPNMNIAAAVTTGGSATISGNVTVNGNDAAPAGWTACSPGANVAGAAIAPTSVFTVNGGVSVNGNPPSVTTAAAADTNTYFNYGSQSYWSLAATANLVYAGGTLLNGVAPLVAGGNCTVSANPANWGEPNHALPASPCETYFPVIHALGNLKVTGGRGQGILLVDGDVEFAGQFEFTGIIIARGGAKLTGGSKAVGALMAASVSADDNLAISGNTSVLYSSCALLAAMSANAYPKAARQRGWVDIF